MEETEVITTSGLSFTLKEINDILRKKHLLLELTVDYKAEIKLVDVRVLRLKDNSSEVIPL